MNLPRTLGKSGKAHEAIQYRNANTTEVEAISWTEEEKDRQEMAAYTTTKVVGSATLRGDGDAAVRTEDRRHEENIHTPDVGHHGPTVAGDSVFSDAWRYQVHVHRAGLEDRPPIVTRRRRRSGCDKDKQELQSIIDMPDGVGRLHCLSAFLWKKRRRQSEGNSQSATKWLPNVGLKIYAKKAVSAIIAVKLRQIGIPERWQLAMRRHRFNVNLHLL